jgi:hypothetical protein
MVKQLTIFKECGRKVKTQQVKKDYDEFIATIEK